VSTAIATSITAAEPYARAWARACPAMSAAREEWAAAGTLLDGGGKQGFYRPPGRDRRTMRQSRPAAHHNKETVNAWPRRVHAKPRRPWRRAHLRQSRHHREPAPRCARGLAVDRLRVPPARGPGRRRRQLLRARERPQRR